MLMEKVTKEEHLNEPFLPSKGDDSSDTRRVSHSLTPNMNWRPPITRTGLGTFSGVFVPCRLSIIGLILFIRMSWAVGQGGALMVVLMLVLGEVMACMTVLSLSAMATNGKVRAGGAYYLISRSVGPELGGAIGVMFFCANVVGVAFYLQGFVDTICEISSVSGYWPRLAISSSVLITELVINIIGSSLFARTSSFIFWIQTLSLTYAFIALMSRSPFSWTDDGETYHFDGPNWDNFSDNLDHTFSRGESFASVFSIIFPAITGIMAGSSMSGVLKRPELSIPRGELLAFGTSFITYLMFVFAFAACFDQDTLLNQYFALQKACWWPYGLTIGIFVSTTSSALASFQSAARLLQALAHDDLVPVLKVFSKSHRGEPVIALLFSYLIAQIVLFIGSVDAIAPVLTMFFLLTYATMNFAAFIHAIAGHPNFRPRFRYFHWSFAFLGFVLSLGLMFLMQWIATLIALAVMAALAIYIHLRSVEKDWGSVAQSIIFAQVRSYLLAIDERKFHIKFWRPQFLFLCPSPKKRVRMLEFLNYLKKTGLLLIGEVILVDKQNSEQNSLFDSNSYSKYSEHRKKWQKFLDESSFSAFIDIVSAPSFRFGVQNLIMASGLGGMRPNTVVIGFYHDLSRSATSQEVTSKLNSVFQPEKSRWKDCSSALEFQEDSNDISELEYVQVLRDVLTYDHITSLIVLRGFENLDPSLINHFQLPKWSKSNKPSPRDPRQVDTQFSRIDIWDTPWGSSNSFALSLQLAAMLQETPFWGKHCYLRVCSLIDSDDSQFSGTKKKYGKLHQEVIRDKRIQARIHIFIMSEDNHSLYRANESEFSRASLNATNILDENKTVFEKMTPIRAAEVYSDFMRSQSKGAGVTIMPLPVDLLSESDSSSTSSTSTTKASEYLNHLHKITNGLGPVVCVHAKNDVISIDL